MTSVSEVQPDHRPETVRALANQYSDHHTKMENYVNVLYVTSRLTRRLGIEPRDSRGQLAMGIGLFVLLLLPALILTFVTDQWSRVPFVSWIVVAATSAFAITVVYSMVSSSAVPNMMALARALAKEDEIHAMIAWEERWFNHTVSVIAASFLTLAFLAIMFVVQRVALGDMLPIGTVWILAVLTYMLSDGIYPVFMISFETKHLAACRMRLYGLSPIDSSAIQQALIGYNQLAAGNIFVLTPVVVGIVILFPANSELIIPVVATMLLMLYVGTTFGTLVPRIFVGGKVRATKRELMNALHPQLDDYLARVRELSGEEYAEMQRLQTVHDTIRGSADNLLPLGWLARITGGLLLSTITIILSVVVQSYASEWMLALVP